MDFSPNPHFLTAQRQSSKRKWDSEYNRNEPIRKYFEKKFSFTFNKDWSLPEPEWFYRSDRWSYAELQEMKDELNRVKGQLEEFDLDEWSQHTKQRDKAGSICTHLKNIVHPELLTQAWCKFYEILSNYKVVPEKVATTGEFNSVHLCEAPGAFITSLNHYLRTNYDKIEWNWIGNSLNPEYEGNNLSEMIPDNRLIANTRSNWNFGLDNTGDITKYYNVKSLLETVEKYNEVLLVTADGSVDCMSDPGNQENLVEHLHFCEFVTALSMLAQGGTFVLKIFTSFEDSTICLLYFLNYNFSSVHVFKPCSSKSGNSEVYVICLDFNRKKLSPNIWKIFIENYKNPQQKAMLPIESIPEQFLSQIVSLSKIFMHEQVNTINENVYYFDPRNRNRKKESNNDNAKFRIAQFFIYNNKVKSICQSERIVHKVETRKHNFRITKGSIVSQFVQIVKELDIIVGKELQEVRYSPFCETELLEKLTDFSQVKATQSMYLKTLKIDGSECKHTLNATHFFDNRTYRLTLFKEFHNLLSNLSVGDSVVLTGYIFLTRFEVGLLYLLMSCFVLVDYFEDGVIILTNCTGNVTKLLDQFKQVEASLDNVKTLNNGLTLSVLTVVRSNYIFKEHLQRELKRYNRTTINFSLKYLTC